ncbi:hypothetical protein ACWEKT_37615 [Nocardia takedensis]
MTLWDKIVRGSAWSSGPAEADIARYLAHSETCPLCLRHGCADSDPEEPDAR